MRITWRWGGKVANHAKVVIGLSEAVESLRAELMKAVEAGKDQPMQFSVDPIELTAQVAVTKDANGKIGWHLLGLGASYGFGDHAGADVEVDPGVEEAGRNA